MAALFSQIAVPTVQINARTTRVLRFVMAYIQRLALSTPAEGVTLMATNYGTDAEKKVLSMTLFVSNFRRLDEPANILLRSSYIVNSDR